jgi:3-phenylpropionate/trans-cinnamate dioxygenase ferredoxin reductase component
MTRQMVIVGAGLAGAKAAETLRSEGFSGSVMLIGAETHRPYERPPLSKKVLGGADPDQAFVHEIGWYAGNDVELRTSEVVDQIDLSGRSVHLAGGEHVAYDKLLLATGSSAIALPVPGAHLEGVRYLRTLDESREIAAALAPGRSVVIVGGGWIGLEVAAAARQAGAEASIVESAVLPLLRVLGPEVAEIYTAVHRHWGVDFHLGASVSRIEGTDHVTGVRLEDGTTLPADLVVVGIGIRPNVDLAVRAGLEVSNGVVTDAGLRTSDPHVYACGDVAYSRNPLLGQHIRVEHWANALNGGAAAARAMLGHDIVYDRVPYFYSDQYDSAPGLGMEYAGYVGPGGYDRVVLRGDPTVGPDANPEFLAFWVKDGRVLAGMNANIWDVNGARSTSPNWPTRMCRWRHSRNRRNKPLADQGTLGDLAHRVARQLLDEPDRPRSLVWGE